MESNIETGYFDQHHEPPGSVKCDAMYRSKYEERGNDTRRQPRRSSPSTVHTCVDPASHNGTGDTHHNGTYRAEYLPCTHHGSRTLPKPRPTAIRTQTHHRSRFAQSPGGCNMPGDINAKNGNQSSDSPSPHGSSSDSGISSQRSSISRHAEGWKERSDMVNSASFDQSAHMRYYPQMSRSVTPDTLAMTESRYDYDTASLPRTPHSRAGRTGRKLPMTSTQRPLRSYSQMDMSHNASQRDRDHRGFSKIDTLPNKFHLPNHGDNLSNHGFPSRTTESLHSSQESVLTYVEGYGYGHTNLQRGPVLDRTASFHSDIHRLQSPSIPNLPRHPSPMAGYPLPKRGLPVAPHYASSPVVNIDHSRQLSPTVRDQQSPKYIPAAAIVEEEEVESEEPANTAPTDNKKSRKLSTRKVINVLVHKLSGQSKSSGAAKKGKPSTGDTERGEPLNSEQSAAPRSPSSSPPLSPSQPKSIETIVQSPPTKSLGRTISGIGAGGVPALIGLRNHGNTCYMNSVIQCLSNTDRLAEYFVLGRHQEDLLRVRKNRNRRSCLGTRGEMTEGLARLLQSIWFLRYQPKSTEEFRRLVGRYAGQYRGDEQHDSQEFLIWLLDIVHEDLNSGSPKKKFRPIKNSHTKPDQLLAAESRANYLRHNNSFIHNVFHAQFRSSLRCLHCGQQSCTFEPFLCLSLPIPQRAARVIPVVVAFITGDPRVIKVATPLDASDSITELRTEVAKQCQIAVTRLVLCEVYMGGFYRCFSDEQPLSEIRDQDSVYGIEIPNNSHSSMSSTQVRPYIHGVYHGHPIKEPVTLVVVSQVGYGRVAKRFGQPMAVEVDRNVNLNQLKVVLLKAMGCTDIEDIMAKNCSLRIGVFSDQNGNRTIITSHSNRPLYHHIVSSMLQFTASKGEPPHVKAVVEWKDDLTHLFSAGAVDMSVSEAEDYKRLMSARTQPVQPTLHDCLDLFTQEEKLAEDNAWQCMNCHKPQQCTKRLSLWSLPEILVVHLKRFKQTSSTRQKLSTMVEFPVNGLDLSSYVVEQNQNQNNQSASRINLINNLTKWSQWRAPSSRSPPAAQGQECVYDLHAVCNHTGTLSGGHYTAYCKNSTNNRWYHFDDTKVTSVSEDQVATRGAYILFYHRRTAFQSGSNGSFSHWWLQQDSNPDGLPNGDVPVMDSLPRKGKSDSSPSQEGYINGFGSLRLRDVRASGKHRKESGRGTWNARAPQSRERLDSGIVISNGHSEQIDGVQGDESHDCLEKTVVFRPDPSFEGYQIIRRL